MAEAGSGVQPAKGTQTLARGLDILKFVVASQHGATIAEVSEFAQVHRTIAYRVLETLAAQGLISRGADQRYRGAFGLLALAAGAHADLRQAAHDALQHAADELGTTLAMLVVEGHGQLRQARAVLVSEPRTSHMHLTFREGSTHYLHEGAAGVALTAMLNEEPLAPAYTTFGEVEPGMHGIAVPLVLAAPAPKACLLAITQRADLEDDATVLLTRVATQVANTLTPNAGSNSAT